MPREPNDCDRCDDGLVERDRETDRGLEAVLAYCDCERGDERREADHA